VCFTVLSHTSENMSCRLATVREQHSMQANACIYNWAQQHLHGGGTVLLLSSPEGRALVAVQVLLQLRQANIQVTISEVIPAAEFIRRHI
jgi:hypothetical protein